MRACYRRYGPAWAVGGISGTLAIPNRHLREHLVSEPSQNPQTRRAVLEQLKLNGPRTVAQLREALNVTGVAVRRHLDALEREGVVRQTSRSSGRGRPAHVYSLTELGHDLFPRNYHQLVVQLLEAVGDRFGGEAVEALFAHRREVLAELYRARTVGRDLPGLASEVAAIQDENGYMADCQAIEGERWLVQEHNCAIARVAKVHPPACANELALFRQLAGPDVQVDRVAHMQAGDSVCAYVFRRGER
jgi:predicted ArsR family transcriptional regulator